MFNWSILITYVYWPGIEVMTIHFWRIIGQLSTFRVTASRVCERDNIVGAPEGKLEIVTIGKRNPKRTFVILEYCILLTIVDILESIVISGIVLYSLKRYLCQMSTTHLLYPNPILTLLPVRGCREPRQIHVRSCRRFLPTDTISPMTIEA